MKVTYERFNPKKACLLYLLVQKSGAIVTALAANGSTSSSFKSMRHLAARSSTVRATVYRLGINSLASTSPCSAPRKSSDTYEI